MIVFCPLGRHVGNPFKDFVTNLFPKRTVSGNTVYLFPPVIVSPASATTAITLAMGALFVQVYIALTRVRIAAQYSTTVLVGSVGAILRRRMKIPLVANYGDPDFAREHGLAGKAFKFCENLVLARGDAYAVVYVDEVIGDYLESEYHTSRKLFLPNGGYERGFNPASPDDPGVTRLRETLSLKGKKVIVYAGHVSKGYRIDIVPQAASQVVSKFPDAAFMIIGEGPALPRLMREVDMLGLSKSFRFLGPIPYKEMSEYLALSEIGLQLLNDMCMGTKVLMYMANRVAVVSVGKWYDKYGKFLRNGENALLVPPDAGSLASAVEELLHDGAQRSRLVGVAWDSIRPYSWDTHADVTLSLLRDATEKDTLSARNR